MPQITITPEERQRRKARNRKIVIGFFVFIGLVVGLESPLTRVRHIEVTGNSTIVSREIVSDTDIHTGESLWQVNSAHAAAKVTSMEPMVQSVSIKTSWLQGTIHVAVRERDVVAIYETSGDFYELLNNGVVYAAIKPTNGLPFPVITSAQKQVTTGQAVSPEVAEICKQLPKISAAELVNVSEFHANGDGTVSLYLDNRFVVTCDISGLVGGMNAMRDAVSYFVQKGYKPGTIDLSGSPPYRYTPYSSSGTATGGKSP